MLIRDLNPHVGVSWDMGDQPSGEAQGPAVWSLDPGQGRGEERQGGTRLCRTHTADAGLALGRPDSVPLVQQRLRDEGQDGPLGLSRPSKALVAAQMGDRSPVAG